MLVLLLFVISAVLSSIGSKQSSEVPQILVERHDGNMEREGSKWKGNRLEL